MPLNNTHPAFVGFVLDGGSLLARFESADGSMRAFTREQCIEKIKRLRKAHGYLKHFEDALDVWPKIAEHL